MDETARKPAEATNALKAALEAAISILRLSDSTIRFQHVALEAAESSNQMIQANNRELWDALERIQICLAENGPIGALPDLEAEPDPAVISEHICTAIMKMAGWQEMDDGTLVRFVSHGNQTVLQPEGKDHP